METEAVVVSEVRARHDLTPYVRIGDAFALACALLAAACVAGAVWPRLGWMYRPAA